MVIDRPGPGAGPPPRDKFQGKTPQLAIVEKKLRRYGEFREEAVCGVEYPSGVTASGGVGRLPGRGVDSSSGAIADGTDGARSRW
jgi:hypothetical protein